MFERKTFQRHFFSSKDGAYYFQYQHLCRFCYLAALQSILCPTHSLCKQIQVENPSEMFLCCVSMWKKQLFFFYVGERSVFLPGLHTPSDSVKGGCFLLNLHAGGKFIASVDSKPDSHSTLFHHQNGVFCFPTNGQLSAPRSSFYELFWHKFLLVRASKSHLLPLKRHRLISAHPRFLLTSIRT